MKFLPALRKAGYAIWPFETVAQRAIVEIYPRLLTGTVNKGNRQARAEYLSDPKFETLPDCWRETAASCEDAFDAAISAYVMNRELEELLSLKATTEPDVLLEGSIWTPEKKN